MAAAVSSIRSIDPSRNANFPVSISEQLLREDGPRKKRRICVQLNHRPKASKDLQRTVITPSKNGRDDQYDLHIEGRDRNDRYSYVGAQKATETTALIFDPVTQSISLDRIDSDFLFNLQSTPTDKDSANLATKYPQLETGLPTPERDDDDDLFDDLAEGEDHRPEDAEPDPSNPYDYRHFLKQRQNPSPSPTPRHNGSSQRPVGLSPVQRPIDAKSQKPKPRPRDRPTYLSPSPAQREEADADNEDSDPNELIIDMGDSGKVERTWHRSALGILNEGGRSNGPISLRSAASSMSPSIRGQSDDDEGVKDKNDDVEEIDLGDERVEPRRQSLEEDDEPMVNGNGNGWDDDEEDDMAAELENAMMQEQAEEPAADPVVNESSSESEEE